MLAVIKTVSFNSEVNFFSLLLIFFPLVSPLLLFCSLWQLKRDLNQLTQRRSVYTAEIRKCGFQVWVFRYANRTGLHIMSSIQQGNHREIQPYFQNLTSNISLHWSFCALELNICFYQCFLCYVDLTSVSCQYFQPQFVSTLHCPMCQPKSNLNTKL